MKKLLKITVIIIASVLVIALVAPIFLKGKISDIVKREANNILTAKLDFTELDISLLRHFPNASLELNGLTLVGGIEPFEGDTIVAADKISIVVNLISVFKESGFEVKQVLLNKPYIHGAKSEMGRVNWDVMKPSEEPVEADAEVINSEDDTTESDEKSTFKLALRNVSINDATIRYEDDSTRMYASISPISLKLSGDFSASHSKLKLESLAQNILLETEGLKLANGIEVEIDADINANLDEKVFVLNENKFRVNAIEMMLDGHTSIMEQGVEVDLKLNSNNIEFREILSLIPTFYTNSFDELKASGELTLAAWAKGIFSQGKLPALELTLGIKDGSFKYSSLPKSVTDINVLAKLENPGEGIDATKVEVSKFGLSMGGNTLAATFAATTPISDLQFNASANGKVNLGAIKEVYPLPDTVSLSGVITADLTIGGRMSYIEKQLFERMQASGSLSIDKMNVSLKGVPNIDIERIAATISPSALTLGEARIKVGNSDLTANGQLSNYLGWAMRDDVLKGRLYINSNNLDANELMKFSTSDNGAETPSDDSSEEVEPVEDSATEPFRVPENLDLALQTSLKRVLFQKMEISDFAGNISIKGGTASLSKLTMKALGGSLSASGSYSSAQELAKPRLSLNASIKEASFSRTFQELELIQKLVPMFEKAGGTYSMNFDLKSSVNQDMSIDYPTLNATGEVSSSNIQLSNVPIFKALSSKLDTNGIESSLGGKLVVIEFTVANGRITTKPFDLQLGSTKINLTGSTGLDQSIDYTAKVSMPGSTAKVLKNLNVKIGGTFSKPEITVDIASAAKDIVGSLIGDGLQSLTGIESKGRSEDIDSQAERIRAQAREAGDKLIQEAERQRENMISKANSRLAKIAAEKAGDLLVKEARQQAQNLMSRAEEQIANLNGGSGN